MIKINTKQIILYTTGIALLLFGQRHFWEDLQRAKGEKEQADTQNKQAAIESNKPFETQEVIRDTIQNTLKNPHIYFQTVHVGKVNINALKRFNKTTVETHDDEHASDSF